MWRFDDNVGRQKTVQLLKLKNDKGKIFCIQTSLNDVSLISIHYHKINIPYGMFHKKVSKNGEVRKYIKTNIETKFLNIFFSSESERIFRRL